ncbi:MAG: ABC transporter substrate-binding protein [Lachnospiraceae bacterium]|nr:ABC transporter substrate-binding protein [Lachnospiraceae bacterium]
MKKTHIIVALIFSMILMLSGCQGKPQEQSLNAGSNDTRDEAVSGEIVIYTSLYDYMVEKMDKKLEEKFPGLKVEFLQGGSGKIQEKIAEEVDSGALGCDIMMVAEPSYSLELKDIGILYPYDYPDKDKLMFEYDRDGYWYPVRVCNMVLAYDPEKYDISELATSFKDFAEKSELKGQISMNNPLGSGTTYSSFVGLLDKYGEDYYKKLSKQGVLIASGSEALEKLEAGEIKEIMVLEESVLKKRQEEGSKLEIIYPEDGSILIPSTIMIVDEKVSKNKNIKAAQAVEEYLLSPEGQNLMVEGWMYSVRKDVRKYPYDAVAIGDIVDNVIPVDWDKCYQQRASIREKIINNFDLPD